MAPITTSTEIARPGEEVFAYVTDPSTMPEWQQGAVSGHMDAPTTRVGSKCTTIRRIGGREREVTTEITEYDPPQRWADRGIDGPIRAIVAVTVEPLADRSRSRLTIELDFIGHGIGKLLVPLIVRDIDLDRFEVVAGARRFRAARLAELASAQGQFARAARLFGAAASIREGIAAPIPPADRVDYDHGIASLRETLGEAAFATAWDVGRALSWQQAADEAQGT